MSHAHAKTEQGLSSLMHAQKHLKIMALAPFKYAFPLQPDDLYTKLRARAEDMFLPNMAVAAHQPTAGPDRYTGYGFLNGGAALVGVGVTWVQPVHHISHNSVKKSFNSCRLADLFYSLSLFSYSSQFIFCF